MLKTLSKWEGPEFIIEESKTKGNVSSTYFDGAMDDKPKEEEPKSAW